MSIWGAGAWGRGPSPVSRGSPGAVPGWVPRAGRRRRAETRRGDGCRILATARRKLREDPDASLDSISQAAGLARRTLYGHFPNRRALIADLTQKAGR
ncbi:MULTISPECIES: TetR/AcrR family transcriptional regulator [unclassified Streptomyces]|uniref:TetR/AcrR family transcriptional regulator n=1 Tax=Streptomyces TaxID=1883 RepID=UPI0033ABF467